MGSILTEVKRFFCLVSCPCFPLLGLTPCGLFMGLSGTLIYTSELVLCSTICVPSATQHIIHKARIVHDASAIAGKGCKSLTECLYRGPVILEDLCGLLLRFKTHKVALTADVEKAVLQVGLQPINRDVTRFLWLKDPTKPLTKDNLQIDRFTRVRFEVITSPFLLGATMLHHLEQAGTPTSKKITCMWIIV